VREGELAPLQLGLVEADHREVGPVVPADKLRAHALQARQGDVNLDRARADHVGVGEDQPVRRDDHAGADARIETLRALLKGVLPHVDADDGVEQPLEPARDGGAGRHRCQAKKQQGQRRERD